MILKIRDNSYDRNENDAWFVLADVISVHRSNVQYRCPNGCSFNEGCEKCLPAPASDWSLVTHEPIKKTKGAEEYHETDCWQLFVLTSSFPDGKFITASYGSCYLMNDNGKTIDRF